jgi:hypothetical protein
MSPTTVLPATLPVTTVLPTTVLPRQRVQSYEAEGYTVQKLSGDYKHIEVDEATGIAVDSGLECGK